MTIKLLFAPIYEWQNTLLIWICCWYCFCFSRKCWCCCWMTSWASVFCGSGADWVLFKGRCLGIFGRLEDLSFIARGDWGWDDMELWPWRGRKRFDLSHIPHRNVWNVNLCGGILPEENIFCCLICSFWRRCCRSAWWLGLTLDSRPVWSGTDPSSCPGKPCLISVDLSFSAMAA